MGDESASSSSQASHASTDLRKGDEVWFDPGVGYPVVGEVVDFSRYHHYISIQATVDNKTLVYRLDNMAGITPRYDLGERGVEDMINLPDLSEGALLWNLRTRYEKELIYTYTGSILVAVNPYRFFDVYGNDNVKRYSGQVLGTLPPHLFAIGNEAYMLMQKQQESQVVIISGESGAGKTESTKLLLRYLAAVNRSAQNAITEQIVEASPLLESFGNAKTTRNDNSSRFGKYVEVKYRGGSIEGAKISQYLLEKSRVVTHGSDERSYHVFYEMLAGMDPNRKRKYGLGTANDYFYLNQGGLAQMSLKNDREDFKTLVAAMDVINFSSEERDSIFSILAAVLHLGNVYFNRKLPPDEHYVEIGDHNSIQWVSQLLKLDEQWLEQGLTMKVTEARQERMLTPFTMEQAVDTRDAISKVLYSNLFDWLVRRVNKIIHKDGKHCSIAILDIFGFEDFATNSFEQLCINYANETLQYYFNKHIFKMEQAEYEKEGITWTFIEFEDNQPTINLIARKPSGIIHLLDDESNFPKGTDLTFLDKCHYNHTENSLYSKPRMSAPQFIVKHYAGKITYTVTNFVEKNKDTLRNDVLELLCQSGNPLIAAMFREAREKKTVSKTSGRYMNMKPRTTTVAASFHESLLQLIDNMSRCNPFFVRCIKPNNHKSPMRYDMEVVLDQLRYTGMLETIKIRKLGYPVRLRFNVFVARHHFLLGRQKVADLDMKKYCTLILKQSGGMYNQHFQLGKTKVFLKESFYKRLEVQTKRVMVHALVRVQKHVRGYIVRKDYLRRRQSSITIQKYWRRFQQRKEYLKLRAAAIKAQALIRMRQQKMKFGKMREQARKRKAEEDRKRRLEEKKAKLRKLRERREKREKSSMSADEQPSNADNRVKRIVSLLEEREIKERVQQSLPVPVHHLEVPAQLAMLFSLIDDWQSVHTERNISAHVGRVAERDVQFHLPDDINQHTVPKMVNVLFKSTRAMGMKSEPITEPFLPKASEADVQESLMIFKLILRYMNDSTLTPKRDLLLGDYIIQKGIANVRLRDEVYCQLVNQTWRNRNLASLEKGWLLMAGCLSAFPPSNNLYKYLLKYVSDHAYNGYKSVCQHKLLQCYEVEFPLARNYPPTMLEWKTHKQKCFMALHLHYADGTIGSAAVDSWTTCEELASYIISQNRNIADAVTGWSVCLRESNRVYDSPGCEFVLDLIGELEVPAHFPCTPADFLVSQVPTREEERRTFENTPHNPDHPRIYAPSLDPGSGQALVRSQAVFVAGTPRGQNTDIKRTSAMVATPFVPNQSRRPPRPNSAIFMPLHESPIHDMSKSFSSQDLSRSRLNERYFSSPQNRPFDNNARDKIKRRQLRKQSSISERTEMESTGSDFSQFIDDVFDDVLCDDREADLVASAAMITALRGRDYDVNDAQNDVRKDTNDRFKRSCVRNGDIRNCNVDLDDVNRSNVPSDALERFVTSLTDDVDRTLEDMCDTSRLVQKLQGGGAGVKDGQERPSTSINLPTRPIASTAPRIANGAAVVSPSPSSTSTVDPVQNLLQQQKLTQQHLAGNQQALLQAAVQQQALQNELLQQTLQGELLKQQLYQVQTLNQRVPPAMTSQSAPMTSSAPNQSTPQTPMASVAPRVPETKKSPQRKVVMSDKIETIPNSLQNGSPGGSPPNETTDDMQNGPSEGGSKVANLAAVLAAKFGGKNDTPADRAKTVRVANVQWPPRKNSKDAQKGPAGVGKLVLKEPKKLNKKVKTADQRELHDLTMELIKSRSATQTEVDDDSSLSSLPTSPSRSEDMDTGTGSTNRSADPTSPRVDMKARAKLLEAQLSGRSSTTSPDSSPEKINLIKRHAPGPPPLTVREVDRETKPVVPKPTPAPSQPPKQQSPPKQVALVAPPDPPPEPEPDFDINTELEVIETTLLAPNTGSTYTYTRTPWQLHIRKELFTPTERLDNPVALTLVFCQVVLDVLLYPCIRISRDEKAKMRGLLESQSISLENYSSSSHKSFTKKVIVDKAREWDNYFSRFYSVSCAGEYPHVHLLGVSHTGVRLVRRVTDYAENSLSVIHLIKYEDILDIEVVRLNQLVFRCRTETIAIYSKRASGIKRLVEAFCIELEKGNMYVRAVRDYVTRDATLLSFKKGDVIKVTNKDMHLDEGWLYGTFNGRAGMFPIEYVVNLARHDVRRNSAAVRPWSTSAVVGAARRASSYQSSVRDDMSVVSVATSAQQPPVDGKHSMMEFALLHFRQALNKYEMLRKDDGSIRGTFKLLERIKIASYRKKTKKAGEWGWREESEMIKWTKSPIQASLLRWHSNNKLLNKAALECFISIMRYMGDYPYGKNQKDIDCIYVILLACHHHPQLRDEVYCQLCKQTTNNKSIKPDSATRGWRLFSILTAYFDCSEVLQPYMLKYLQDAALDVNRIHHSIASIALQNIRKTFLYGGRKNVPNRAELEALTRGRLSKRQMFLLPGGIPVTLNLRPVSVIDDVINEICDHLNIKTSAERDEYTIYYVIEKDHLHSPLMGEEYLFDVTTDLMNQKKEYHMLFQRTTWYYDVRLDYGEKFIDVMYNQCLPTYHNGNLVVCKNHQLTERQTMEIAKLAALQHRSKDRMHLPSMTEVHEYLPRGLDTFCAVSAQGWVNLVHKHLRALQDRQAAECKADFLDLLVMWPLFGSKFFRVKSVSDSRVRNTCLMAVNKKGVYLVDENSHESLIFWPLAEVLSTRFYSTDRRAYLDLKCGNLLLSKTTRVETDYGADISRIIAQYVRVMNKDMKTADHIPEEPEPDEES